MADDDFKKITVKIPAALLDKALEFADMNIMDTVTLGLEKVVASGAYKKALSMGGLHQLDLDADDLSGEQ